MFKTKRVSAVSLTIPIVSLLLFQPVSAEEVPSSSILQEGQPAKVEMDDLVKEGFDEHDLHIANHLAKKTEGKASAEALLKRYKELGSWVSVAKEYSIEFKEKDKRPSHKMRVHIEEHRSEVIKYLSTYTGVSEEKLTQYTTEGVELHKIARLAPLSKLTGESLDELIGLDLDKRSLQDYVENKKIDLEALKKERREFRKGLIGTLESL
ncbi:hypothetical protein LCM10_16160 [Rossellomorea aquimaris]|uniref:hypothetical protein n=1 Tax=Rossellomorea aquimaris TaxID=189382 RepID=UPI001CD5E515|nr:hypothetical protein [Rossellomorea aquimaris]MCA1056536.1 hypothetical protein [Rossellomorea aquimaris]